MRYLRWILSCLVFVWLAWPAPAEAHVGAPYPVLLEEAVGPYVVSAMADPDVGKGTFYVSVTLDGEDLHSADTVVALWAEPLDGHLAEARTEALRKDTRHGVRHVAEVPFDAEGPWQLRLVIEGPAGSGETSFPVNVTPSGVGVLATLACLVPFFILGGLWLRGTLRQRSAG